MLAGVPWQVTRAPHSSLSRCRFFNFTRNFKVKTRVAASERAKRQKITLAASVRRRRHFACHRNKLSDCEREGGKRWRTRWLPGLQRQQIRCTRIKISGVRSLALVLRAKGRARPQKALFSTWPTSALFALSPLLFISTVLHCALTYWPLNSADGPLL